MKWLALVLLFIQADYLSSCIFEKVQKMQGVYIRSFMGGVNECFAACYMDKNCTTIRPELKGDLCVLYGPGDYQYDCDDQHDCYVLQRNEVDSMCKTYVNF